MTTKCHKNVPSNVLIWYLGLHCISGGSPRARLNRPGLSWNPNHFEPMWLELETWDSLDTFDSFNVETRLPILFL